MLSAQDFYDYADEHFGWAEKRPSRCCSAEKRGELTPPHSITSSVVASSDVGTSRRSALAVLRLGRELHWQVGRRLALEDTTGIDCRLPKQFRNINSVGHQAAVGGGGPQCKDCRHSMARRQFDEELALRVGRGSDGTIKP